ncbi:MAG: class I SAM-dependent methyltransferase [Alphaproteobacteria bacterium]|nr:class I SAM-dependent methyltransferase [Alphaproteobacteria bacterium]
MPTVREVLEAGIRALDRGETGRALAIFDKVLAFDPAQPDAIRFRHAARQRLIGDLAADPSALAEASDAELCALLDDPGLDPRTLANSLLERVAPRWPKSVRDTGALSDPLLHAVLRATAWHSLPLEGPMTALRRDLLDLDDGVLLAEPVLGLAAALATQMFRQEFVCLETKAERDRLAALQAELEAGNGDPVASALRVALYRPLSSLALSEDVAEALLRQGEPALSALFATILGEPWAERALMADIPALTPVLDATSIAVAEMYDENPFPRWPRMGPVTPLSMGAWVGDLRAQGYLLDRDGAGPVPHVLVAGAGTGQHPLLMARSFPETRFLGIDIAKRSLALATHRARLYSADNLCLAEADILALNGADASLVPEDFRPCLRDVPMIQSFGVLHHLADPLAGWRALTDLMAEDGVMLIALYTERGRRNIVPVQDYLAALRPAAGDGDPDRVRRARKALLALPDDHRAAGARQFADFFVASHFRDLFLHVQEHVFSLERIGASLAELGLVFLGAEPEPPVADLFRAENPAPEAWRDLAAWDRFEARHPDAFLRCFSFWCGRPR